MSGCPSATIKPAGKGGDSITNKLSQRERLNHKVLQAAIQAVERLQKMVRDDATSNGDVLKAAGLILGRLNDKVGEQGTPGDFEIVMKDD